MIDKNKLSALVHKNSGAILIAIAVILIIVFTILFIVHGIYAKYPIVVVIIYGTLVILPLTAWYLTREKHSVSDTIQMITNVLKRDDVSEDIKDKYAHALEKLKILPSDYVAS